MEKQLQENEELTGENPKCGGKDKPAPKEGAGPGDWLCVNDEWVWFSA